VAPVGRTINESSPLVDARLKDGSRVNAIIPPLALTGPTLTIRKFAKRRLTTDDLIRFGSLDRKMVEFLELAVRERMNVVISGGTGSGKTTLLNLLSGFIPDDERIITVEDAAELQLNQEHVISLETRPPNMEGNGAITIRDLVKNCLRMRPDRIVIGECRGGEALDMLQLETMVLMSGMDLPIRAIREQIASAINLIVQQSRLPDGSRKITHITEVTGMQGEVISLQEIFTLERSGFDDKGKVIGKFVAHDIIPNFVQDLSGRGVKVNLKIFQNQT
jgi:pilus assembly protein CpaF